MSAYVLVHGTPKNIDQLKSYSEAAHATFPAFQGQILAKGKPELLTGEHDSDLVAVIEFPSAELARAWYQSPEYQKLLPLREQAMSCCFILCA